MTMHSLHNDDRAFSQAMMDRVMGNGRRVRLMTRRERQQRWLVNQKYARWVVSLLNVKNRKGIMCLIAWGLWFFNFLRTDWKQIAGREVALWLSMPAILLALFFESELGNFSSSLMIDKTVLGRFTAGRDFE